MKTHFSHLSRRDFLRLAAASAAASMLTACGVSATPQAPSKSPVQLVYQDWRTDWFPAMAQEQLAEFNSDHPDIRVFYTPDPDNKVEKMVADMAAGTAPDLMSGCCDFFPEWADAGQLLDLRPYVAQDLDEAAINEHILVVVKRQAAVILRQAELHAVSREESLILRLRPRVDGSLIQILRDVRA